MKEMRFDALEKICQVLDYRPADSLEFVPNESQALALWIIRRLVTEQRAGYLGGMNMIFDISDRARLPWRFFGVAKSSLRPRL